MTYEFEFLSGEYFWGGSAIDGRHHPIKPTSNYKADFRRTCTNQVMPLFLSNKGRYIWSDNAFAIEIKNGKILIEGDDVKIYEAGETLKDARSAAMNRHFPCDKRQLPLEFFTAPQFNTWMEFTYHPTQEGVISYAEKIIEHGFKPGIFIIDEGWQQEYGLWDFDKAKFPDPKAMVDRLHELGFKLMVWVAPWLRPDGFAFVMNTTSYIKGVNKNWDRLFLRDAKNDYALMHWWNGISAMLDMRKDCDREFLENQLSHLMEDYGVDGFKFDGGKVGYGGYHPCSMVNEKPQENHDPYMLNIAWNEFGRKYEYHEYKDTYKGGGKNGIQRLADCAHKWDGGANILIPDTLIQGLIGHPFVCPDMVAGGSWAFSVDPDFVVDEEMFIRMAQASVLCPMVQFSWAPWRALSEKSLNIVKKAVELRQSLTPYIEKLVKDSFTSCEPIVRIMEYDYPNQGFEDCMDCFMLGDKYLVAPVTVQGATKRTVKLPQGKWKYVDSLVYEGGVVTVDAPIDVLPYFEKIDF